MEDKEMTNQGTMTRANRADQLNERKGAFPNILRAHELNGNTKRTTVNAKPDECAGHLRSWTSVSMT